jgi:hypothetical protein
MKIVIENQILSPVQIFSCYVRADSVTIEMHDTYQKRTYRNRFVISGPGGRHVISIPLKKGKNSLRSSEVQISYDIPWVRNLAATIRSFYGSAPYFDHYYTGLIDVFQKKHLYLAALNNELRDYVLKSLDMDIPISYTDQYIVEYGEYYRDMRDKYSPLKTPEQGIVSEGYNQVFEDKNGFLPGLSIIDLIFNTGKYALHYLVSQPSK